MEQAKLKRFRRDFKARLRALAKQRDESIIEREIAAGVARGAAKLRAAAYQRKHTNKGLKSKWLYAYLFKKQKGQCAICKRSETRRLSLDHCHATNRIRGLLCLRCNLGIGFFHDSVKSLKAAIRYLKRDPAQIIRVTVKAGQSKNRHGLLVDQGH
jgi:hypothetical protein